MEAEENKRVVPGLVFLKYLLDAFEELRAKLQAGEGEYEGADPGDADEYRAENVFFVPPNARWTYLQARTKLPEICKDVNAVMEANEKDNLRPRITPSSGIPWYIRSEMVNRESGLFVRKIG